MPDSRRPGAALALLLATLASACGGDGRELGRLQVSANVEYARLKVIANDLKQFRAQQKLLLEKQAEAVRELELADSSLEEVGEEVGFEAEPRSFEESSVVRFRTAARAPDAVELAKELVLPRGATLRDLRCAPEGCRVTLAAVPRSRWKPLVAGLRENGCEAGGPLPPRPRWPRRAEAVWEEVRRAREECETVRRVVGELADQPRLVKDLGALLDLLAQEGDTELVLDAATAAAAAGAKTFQVKSIGYAVQVSTADAGPGFEATLRELGKVERQDDRWIVRKPLFRPIPR